MRNEEARILPALGSQDAFGPSPSGMGENIHFSPRVAAWPQPWADERIPFGEKAMGSLQEDDLSWIPVSLDESRG